MVNDFKLRFNINAFLLLVLMYPIILFFPSLFNKEAFFLTTPYFFLVFVLMAGVLFLKGKFTSIKHFKLIMLLIIVVFYNFSSLRYSLPVFFVLYVLLFLAVLNTIKNDKINIAMVELIFYLYIIFSIPFIFLPQGWDTESRFLGFIGSPTVYAGIMTAMFVLVARKWKLKTWKFIIIYIIIVYLIYISKTRLLLIFLVVFPIINYLVINKLWFTKKRVYLLFLLTTISVYPLYGVVTNMFPTLVSIRYEEGSRDKSFGLRLYLNNALSEDYKKGTVVQKAFGKGNEYSRNFVKDLFKFDIFPHNDFLRILTDWGLLGVLIFMYLLYLFAIKNTDSLYISLIYILLFYSNMVFNIFIISLLIIFYFNNNNLLIENGTQK